MMIEPLYDFSLTAEQEARARTLHESSIILDMLFRDLSERTPCRRSRRRSCWRWHRKPAPATRSPSVTGQRLRFCAG